MKTVAALYVEPNGCYVGVPGVDPWPESRDARTYEGPHPVVAHPPCQRWGRFWHGSTRKPHQFKKGDDDGCFAAALAATLKWGGRPRAPRRQPRMGGLRHPKATPQRWVGRCVTRSLDVLRLPGPLRAQKWQANVADRRTHPKTTRTHMGQNRAALAAVDDRPVRLRESQAHRRRGHGWRQTQNRYTERNPKAFSRLADCHREVSGGTPFHSCR